MSLTSKVMAEIQAERLRQVEREGFGPEHDDHHQAGVLARAGAVYACLGAQELENHQYDLPPWPWGEHWLKPKDARRNLVRAAALIAAEIERIDRTRGGEGCA